MAGRKAQARATNARQAKVAAIRAQEARRRRQMNLVMGAIGLVLVVIVAFIIVKAVGSSGNAPVASGPTGKVVNAVTTVPASVFDKVGPGSVDVEHGAGPQPIKGGGSLTADGKPKILYVGAEFCPFCAAERWPVVAALSRFGTFSGLGTTRSAGAPEYFPNTATLSFHGASYDSKYLTFAGYETEDRNRSPLDQLPPEDDAVFKKFDFPPYTQSQGAIPFVDLGGKFMISGASYDVQVLHGKTHVEIAQAMHDPSSDIAQAVDGTANLISARVCQLTNQQPANVCNSPGVTAAANAMKAS